MKVREIQVIRPTELVCSLVSTIAAQTFAVCSLGDYELGERFARMGVHIRPQDLMGSITALENIFAQLTSQNSGLKNPAKLKLKQLQVLLDRIYTHTNVATVGDAWADENDGDDDDD
jgi:hypothetical protein